MDSSDKSETDRPLLLTMPEVARIVRLPVDHLPRVAGLRGRLVDLSGRQGRGPVTEGRLDLWRMPVAALLELLRELGYPAGLLQDLRRELRPEAVAA